MIYAEFNHILVPMSQFFLLYKTGQADQETFVLRRGGADIVTYIRTLQRKDNFTVQPLFPTGYHELVYAD